MNSFNSLSGKINNNNAKFVYNVNIGVLNNITNKSAILGSGLKAGAYGLVKLNTNYSGATIQIKRSADATGTDFYAQSTTTYGSLQTLGGIPLITFLGGQTAYVTIWYDQTGNGNNANSAPTPTVTNFPTYNTSTNSIDFGATGYFTIRDGAFPSGNSAYSFLFTPQNQPASTNQVIYTGGTYTSNPFGKYLQGMIYYTFEGSGPFSYFNVWFGYNVFTNSSVSNGIIVADTPAVLNNVNISDTYNGQNANTRTLYFNGVSVPLSTAENTKIRDSTTTGNFLGNKGSGQGDTNKFTGRLKYFIWAPIQFSLTDINIIHKVATNIVS